jgi:hypothetical protein
MAEDRFFTQPNCDRCGGDLRGGRTMSWFTQETICMGCSDKERDIKRQLREAGQRDAGTSHRSRRRGNENQK